jgi:hypothetical protein
VRQIRLLEMLWVMSHSADLQQQFGLAAGVHTAQCKPFAVLLY